MIKQTPLYPIHVSLGARMAEFGGYQMPISYSGVNDEHRTVRQNAGVFDVSHMGEFMVSGKTSLPFLQYLVTNDVSKLTAGKAQYNCMLDEQGGIIDDLIIYCIEDRNQYMLVVNAGNIDKDWEWINRQNVFDAHLENISDDTCLLAIQGPEANKMMQPLTDIDLQNIRYYSFQQGKFGGLKDVLISATGYTGSGGIEIYFKNQGQNAEHIWNQIFAAGSSQGLKPIGLAARDTLRLEKGYRLYGNDIDTTTSPLEAGLGWIVKLQKEDFIGKRSLVHLKETGILRHIVGIELRERGIPRSGHEIYDTGKNLIGRVTSGTQSPTLNKPIGIGYVTIPFTKPGTPVLIKIRDRFLAAEIVKMPFE